jgi:hypothetical protein
VTDSRSRAEEFGDSIRQAFRDNKLGDEALWAGVSHSFESAVAGIEHDISRNAHGIQRLNEQMGSVIEQLDILASQAPAGEHFPSRSLLRPLSAEERARIARLRLGHRITTYQRRTAPTERPRARAREADSVVVNTQEVIVITADEYDDIVRQRAEESSRQQRLNPESE